MDAYVVILSRSPKQGQPNPAKPSQTKPDQTKPCVRHKSWTSAIYRISSDINSWMYGYKEMEIIWKWMESRSSKQLKHDQIQPVSTDCKCWALLFTFSFYSCGIGVSGSGSTVREYCIFFHFHCKIDNTLNQVVSQGMRAATQISSV